MSSRGKIITGIALVAVLGSAAAISIVQGRRGRGVPVRMEEVITGQEYFEVLSGIQLGDTVVAGPYQLIRELVDGDPVQPIEEEPPNGVEAGATSGS
jgi:hypothetical protein